MVCVTVCSNGVFRYIINSQDSYRYLGYLYVITFQMHGVHDAMDVGLVFIMITSSNGKIFRVTGPLWGNSAVTGEFTSQRAVTRSFDVFFDLRLSKRLSKQSRGWWFETPSRPLWRHCNVCFQASNTYCSRNHFCLICLIDPVAEKLPLLK